MKAKWRFKSRLPNSSSTKAIDEGAVEKSAGEPKRDKLWVRIDMSPEQAGKDKFVLTSSDGSFRVIKTAADDKIPNDDSLDLFFGEVDGAALSARQLFRPRGEKTWSVRRR